MITMKNVQPGRILVCAFFESARHRHCKQTAFRSRAGAGQSRKAKGILVPLLMIEEFGVKAGRGNAVAIGGREFQLARQRVDLSLNAVFRVEQVVWPWCLIGWLAIVSLLPKLP